MDTTFCLACGCEGHPGMACGSTAANPPKQVYVHVLSANELGIGRPGEAGPRSSGLHRRARSCYISPSLAEGFFPHVRSDVPNDKADIWLTPPGLPDVKVEMCFYNSKVCQKLKKGRFEIRIKLPLEAGPNGMYRPGDIIAFHRDADGKHLRYRIQLLAPSDVEYETARSAMGAATHALVDASILAGTNSGSGDSASLPAAVPGADRPRHEGLLTLGGKTFAAVMMNAYRNTCPVSGRSIRFQMQSSLVLTWLQPKGSGGKRSPNNILPLEPGLSWAFERGMFTLTEGAGGSLEVVVHPRMLEDTVLGSLHGQPVAPPLVATLGLSSECISWHRTNVYGDFLPRDELSMPLFPRPVENAVAV